MWFDIKRKPSCSDGGRHVLRMIQLSCYLNNELKAVIDSVIKRKATLYFNSFEKYLKKQPITLDPLEYGWIEHDDKLVCKWFEGDQLPTSVSDLITQVPDSDSMDDEDESHHDRHDSDDDDE
ncbi:unnamed protein product [Psylliodes chrysocephalus]|uniref:Uncharacterized protein n=1 Tax=Psylliodes chrysocephalus TaxID=3402493 RepID=A0A9P0D6J7_9CUCU|nr:unnamed protein product [Psylliodes chrysocephala]